MRRPRRSASGGGSPRAPESASRLGRRLRARQAACAKPRRSGRGRRRVASAPGSGCRRRSRARPHGAAGRSPGPGPSDGASGRTRSTSCCRRRRTRRSGSAGARRGATAARRWCSARCDRERRRTAAAQARRSPRSPPRPAARDGCGAAGRAPESVVVAKQREPVAERSGLVALQGHCREDVPVTAVALEITPSRLREAHVDDPGGVLRDAQVGAAVLDVVAPVHEDRADAAALERAARADRDQAVVDANRLAADPHRHLRLRTGAEPAGLTAELAATRAAVALLLGDAVLRHCDEQAEGGYQAEGGPEGGAHAAILTGRSSATSVRPEARLRTAAVPPWARAIASTIASPSPAPPPPCAGSARVKRSKARSTYSSGNPPPSSLTLSSTWPSRSRASTLTRPSPWRRAFSTRLPSACSSRSRSPLNESPSVGSASSARPAWLARPSNLFRTLPSSSCASIA